MNNNVYDVGVIGMGVAGAFTCYKLAQTSSQSIVAFDIGRKWQKRRLQTCGFLGCFPNSDGKLYLQDLKKISEIFTPKKAKSAFSYFKECFSGIDNLKTISDRSPSTSLDKKIKKAEYDYYLNDHIQLLPKDIHALSKKMAEVFEDNKNINFCFDNEVKTIYKNKKIFHIVSEYQEYKCKKIIIAVGRSGWRWVSELYKNLDIIENNDYSKFGIRIEMDSNYLKDFNKSNCTLLKNNIEIGPLSWYGTVIPEDHVDLSISAFRSNENRWESDKVSFNLIGNMPFPNKGWEQTNRLGQLTFILTNDRISKEKISYLFNKKSKISIIPEYNWLSEAVEDLNSVIPDLKTKGYFHVPTIVPLPPQINIGNNLETEIENMFVIGEAAGITGLLAAACMGIVVADSVL